MVGPRCRADDEAATLGAKVTFTVVPLTDDPDGTRRPRQLDSILALLTRAAERAPAKAGASGSNTKRIAP